jgi:NADP-reducing hydrogenase subunit HndD
MNKVNVTINGNTVSVPEGITVLEAARYANVDIPTLCYLKGVNEIGSCRLCVVEIEGARGLAAACTYPVSEGLTVLTNTPKVRESRKVSLELILSNHDRKCLSCVRNRNCELQSLADQLNVDETKYESKDKNLPLDDFSPSIVRDPNKCVLCRRCVSVCSKVQTVDAINMVNRGYNTQVAPAFNKSLNDVNCVMCGQCIVACPVGALTEKDNTKQVWEALADPDKYVVVQPAPAVRVGLGEEFGLEVGTRVTGKMAAALRRLGFDKVFDTNTGADLTIMEEGTELLQRLKEGKNLPLITSCSPGWIKFCEHYYPEFLDNLSSCKSPHEMLGAIVKSYFAEKENIDPAKIVTVSVMPCTAKKFEAQREEMRGTGYPDVDIVITTRELARMIKEAGIDFVNLPDEEFDNPMGKQATGAGAIFGATGGVMEAALRTVADILTGDDQPKFEYTQVRGTEDIKEATIKIGDTELRAAVAHGLGNARKLLDDVRAGKKNYHFIEIMACPGGCVNGGGQPIRDAKFKMDHDLRKERAKAIYEEDKSLPLRKSHQNPFIKKLYEEYLGEPCGHKSHKLLHTTYTKRDLY